MEIRCLLCGGGVYPKGFTKANTNFVKLTRNKYAHENRRVCMAYKYVILSLEDRAWQDAESVEQSFIERLSMRSLAASVEPGENSAS